ncbi:MAG: shikimate kinase, partial [Gemmataceae bacterium]
VATGGGVILRLENREMLKNAGTVVWLTGEPETLWARIQTDQSTAERRPNLTQGGLQEIHELLSKRVPLYKGCAECTFETDENSPQELATQIREFLTSR